MTLMVISEMNQLATSSFARFCNQAVERPLFLAAGVLGMAWLIYFGLVNFLPLWVRFFFSILSLALLPGYAVFRLLTTVQKSHYDRLSILLVSTSLSFSYNFFLNIIVFSFALSVRGALLCSLCMTTVLYLALFVVQYQVNGSFRSEPFHITHGILWFAGAAIVVAAFTFIRPIQGGYYVEELTVLQKILLNPVIAIKNLSITQGDATTYLFIPFYLLIGMICLICKVNVTTGVQIMWPFTSILALLCLTKITEFITGSRKPAIVIAVAYVITAIFFPQLRSDQLVFLLPTPDRYAFSAGVLLYLALFHFLIHVHDKKLNYAMFIGLIYIIVEVAFVHAREAIMVLGCIFLFLLISFLHQGHRSPYFFKTLVVIGVCVGALAAYKYINLLVSPTLGEFVDASQKHLLDLLHGALNDGSFFTRFFYELPNSPVDRYEFNLGFRNLAPGSVFVGLTLISLPLYILVVNDIWRYWLPLLVSSVLLLLISGPLKLLVGAIVGSEHLFRLTALIYIPCLIIFADMLCLVMAQIGRLSVPNATKGVIVACLAIFLFVLAPAISASWFYTSSRLGDAIFSLGMIVLILCKSTPLLWRWLQSTIRTTHLTNFVKCHWQYIAVAFLALIVISPHSAKFKSLFFGQVIDLDYPQYYDDGVFQNLSKICARDMLAHSFIQEYHLPEEIFNFIRNKLPGQATWLGKSTALILIASNQYSPIVSYKGTLIGAYLHNDNFFDEFGENTISIPKLMEHPAKFEKLLDKYQINYLLVEPEEMEDFSSIINNNPDLARRLQVVFTHQGWSIVKVVTTPADKRRMKP